MSGGINDAEFYLSEDILQLLHKKNSRKSLIKCLKFV